MKYEDVSIVCRSQGDYKVLAFVSGKSKAEIIRKVKSAPIRYNVRMNGMVWIDHPDFTSGINSNKL